MHINLTLYFYLLSYNYLISYYLPTSRFSHENKLISSFLVLPYCTFAVVIAVLCGCLYCILNFFFWSHNMQRRPSIIIYCLVSFFENACKKSHFLGLGQIYNSEHLCVVDIVVQLLSCVWIFATSWTEALQASLSFIIFQNLFKLTSVESVMPSHHLILCYPLLLLPQSFPGSVSFQWVRSSQKVVNVLELQLQHQSF